MWEPSVLSDYGTDNNYYCTTPNGWHTFVPVCYEEPSWFSEALCLRFINFSESSHTCGLISWRLFFGRHILVTHSLPDGSVHFEIRWWGVCISAMKVYYSRPTTQVRRSMMAWIKKCWNQNHEFRTLKFSFLYLLSQKHVVFCKPVS